MRDIVMAESQTMSFIKDCEDLYDDGFEGSTEEHNIFREVFFGKDGNNEFIVNESVNLDCGYTKQTGGSLCSHSGNSSLTSQDDCAKKGFVEKPPLDYTCGELVASIKCNHEMSMSVRDLKPDLGDDLTSAPSEGVISGIVRQDSGSVAQSSTYCLVESSLQGIISTRYQLKQLAYLDKVCEISGRLSSKSRLSSLDQNDQKEATSKAVASPTSQESPAAKLQIADQPVSVANKLSTHRPAKPKWKDSCFLKLDEDEFAMPTDIKNDPRPLLRYHIYRLLRAAGWEIGRRKRNSKYNGVGEYVYRSPAGRPFREFHRAWYLCGESLSTDDTAFAQTSDTMQWADMTELRTDLSHAFKEIEDNLNNLENNSAMAHLWCLLDPFAHVVFIDKSIRLLKEGIAVKAKRSLLTPSDAMCGAKYQKISMTERNPRPLEALRYDGTYQIDVPVGSGTTQLLGRPDAVPCQNSSTSYTNFDQGRHDVSGYTRKAHKKSRKISEIQLTRNHLGQSGNCAIGEITLRRFGFKKSKACGLNDDDLLISAIMKTKTCRATKKCFTVKSKHMRKRKTPKGSCKLLPRSLKKRARYMMEGKWSAFGSRTVLSWLIHSGVVSLNEVIQYRNLKDDAVIKDGLITGDGILCNCCMKVLSISEFKTHAGFSLNRPCMNLFMESGKPLTLCQLEAWSAEYKARKIVPQTDQVVEGDQNDDSCGRCGDVGELICCDNCPSAFHQACLFEQELPEGNWYCPQCRCGICEDVVNDKETSQMHGALKCSQCEHKYHETCMQGKRMKVELASDTWFCGDSCSKVYTGLEAHIGLRNLLSDGFSWTLLRCIPGDPKVHSAQRAVALKAECNSKLAVAITIMEECFLPMVDLKTGIDMIPQVIYNWGSQVARLNYNGFYTVVLEKDDVILSVASIRIHGVSVAELPLVATCSKHRRQGLCRRLINSIEEILKSLKVEKLLVSAIPTLVETWTVGFGFQPLDEDERQSLSKTNLMVFPGAVWLKKPLHENHNMNETCELGAHEGGRNEGNTEHRQLSDENLSFQEDNNTETGMRNGKEENVQSCEEVVMRNQVFPPEISFVEQDPRPHDDRYPEEITTMPREENTATGICNGKEENSQSCEEVTAQNQVLPPELSFEEQGPGLLREEVTTMPREVCGGEPLDAGPNEEKESGVLPTQANQLSENSDCVQNFSSVSQDPISQVPFEELASLSPGTQLEVVCGAEPDGMNVQRQLIV